MLSLKTWAAINLSYSNTMRLEESELSIVALALIEPIARMNEFEKTQVQSGLQEEFLRLEKHVCRMRGYRVRGLQKQIQGRASCWCYCPQGPLCNCKCAALLTIAMEFRENQCWRTIGPNLPKIDLDAPMKNYIFKRLRDPDLFYNVKILYPNKRLATRCENPKPE